MNEYRALVTIDVYINESELEPWQVQDKITQSLYQKMVELQNETQYFGNANTVNAIVSKTIPRGHRPSVVMTNNISFDDMLNQYNSYHRRVGNGSELYEKVRSILPMLVKGEDWIGEPWYLLPEITREQLLAVWTKFTLDAQERVLKMFREALITHLVDYMEGEFEDGLMQKETTQTTVEI